MPRSRSSFDLSDAIVTAEALSPRPPPAEPVYPPRPGVPLVAFDRTRETVDYEVPARRKSAPPPAREPVLARPPEFQPAESTSTRCAKMLTWLASDPTTRSSVVTDSEGLLIAASSEEVEALLGAMARVGDSVRRLAGACPGDLADDFDTCVGDGPYVHVIGFYVAGERCLVGVIGSRRLERIEIGAIRNGLVRALEPAFGKSKS